MTDDMEILRARQDINYVFHLTALHEIKDALNDARASDAEKIRTIVHILRVIGLFVDEPAPREG